MKAKEGRPTAYDPKFCEIVVELGKKNMCLVQIAAELGVCKKTVNNWMNEHDEFLRAIKQALSFAEAASIKQAQEHLVEHKDGPKMNSRIFELLMQNRFGWSRKTENRVDIQEQAAEKLTTEELIELLNKAKNK